MVRIVEEVLSGPSTSGLPPLQTPIAFSTMAEEVLVLYQISNELSRGGGSSGDGGSPSYNAYYYSRKNGPVTLATVKSSCRALHHINANGADGYFWRVRIDEKPNTSHSSGGSSDSSATYSWWDVQDENARLPVKEATPSELRRMLDPPTKVTDGGGADALVTHEVTKAAKGAMKYMGKAMNVVAGNAAPLNLVGDDDDLNSVRTPVICFKLLDLERVRKDLGGRAAVTGEKSRRAAAPAASRPRSAGSNVSFQSPRQQPPTQQQQRAPTSSGVPRIPQQQVPQQRGQPPRTPPTADLMGFNAAAVPPRGAQSKGSTPTGAMPGETRAEKLKREYSQKNTSPSNRVWDDVDQRWVEGPVKNGETSAAATPSSLSSAGSMMDGMDGATTAVKGITLSRDNAVGKSANVQAAVHARIDDMEQQQQKAIAELRIREGEKTRADAEEDGARQRLEPRLKAWSEEHGQKKQLRALLANLHTILWDGSGWKPISLADVLDDSKVKKVYHQASRVVHPDKTGHLDAEKRFVAKRVFDALTQAKVEFDEGKR